jgi:hypothetical protein
MGFEHSTKSGSFSLAPAGNHPARCYGVIDLGHHLETYQGKEIGERKKALLLFEFPTKKHVFDEKKGEEPYTLSIKVTNSLHEKGKLRPLLESWRGAPYTNESIKKFTIDKLIGKTALANVAHKDKTDGDKFAKIVALTPVPDGMVVPDAILPTLLFSVDWGRNHETFKLLPKWIQEECNKCIEWQPKTESQSEVENGAPDAAGAADSEDKEDHPF